MLTTLSAGGLVLMVGGLCGLLTGGMLFSVSPAVIAMQAAAAVLMVWARVTFGRRSFHPTACPTEGRLVTGGPYAWVRHPIYTAVCLFAWAGVLAHCSVLSGALGLVVFAGAVVRMFAEERALRLRYPGYGAYMARTRRMIPGVF
jgi:protein-S-isoprenylcysteine O-methyltransferase Ste14